MQWAGGSPLAQARVQVLNWDAKKDCSTSVNADTAMLALHTLTVRVPLVREP